ncbi:MAG: histidine phosphatase family protein [Microbacterium sp.]|nr:histidine phosphatase family protein [Microbacterium sp.]
MIRLALVRHAKSDWSEEGIADHDRPLNARGERDAPAMVRLLAVTGFAPDVIVSSTATRAQSTALAFGAVFGIMPRPVRRLYAASATTLLDAVEEAGAAGASSVLLVAHNPGIADLAATLSRGRIAHMPTCAVATFSWADDDWGIVDAVDPLGWDLDVPRGDS